MSFMGSAIDYATMEATEDFVPQSEQDLLWALGSWRWRVFSGYLYKITTKGDDRPDDEPETAVPFIPNAAQRLFVSRLHRRNSILKARQMGFSTLITIMALDHALFNRDQEVVIIAHTKVDAMKLFRKKVMFAFDNMPEAVRAMFKVLTRTKSEVTFDNGSSIEVTASARGGTPHFLHVSEFGKISARFPDKAVEITTGSIQGVPANGFVFLESTAEGQAGAFYDISERARAKKEAKEVLNTTDYRFHFFAWWMMPEYRTNPRGVRISAKEHEYFDAVEGEMGEAIDLEQRAWYIQKRDSDFASTPELMWREYPSTPKECWQAATEGKYYATAINIARREGRIGSFPLIRHVPVNSFWDMGNSDKTAVWMHQRVGIMDHWVKFTEDSGKGYLHFINWLESFQCVWGGHYLPHDASHMRQGVEDPTSAVSQMRLIKPSWSFHIVPRVGDVQHGIDLARLDMATACFDAEGCKEGIYHMENYSRAWNTRLQTWANEPLHDDHSDAADAFRQKAQGYAPGPMGIPKKSGKRRPTGMTA